MNNDPIIYWYHYGLRAYKATVEGLQDLVAIGELSNGLALNLMMRAHQQFLHRTSEMLAQMQASRFAEPAQKSK